MAQWKFSCPKCGQHFSGDFGYCGREIVCSVCQNQFTVPSPGSAAPVQTAAGSGRPQRTTVSLPASIPRFPPGAEPAPVGRKRTSGLAVASLICSAGSFILIPPCGFVPGIICGHVARKRFARDPLLSGSAFAKAGLILGYVALGLYVVLFLAFGNAIAKLLR